MEKYILEYFEGDPDVVYDTENRKAWNWGDEMAICFGFLPTSLDGKYEFMAKKNSTHMRLAKKAALKIVGKALSHIKYVNENYIDTLLTTMCYKKSYCKGRYWKFDTDNYPSFIAFWSLPSSRMVAEICRKLNVDVNSTLLATKSRIYVNGKRNLTVGEYIDGGYNGDDGEKEQSMKFLIDSKIESIIRSYNVPSETWQNQKEKEGWKTLAQRNATIYQEENKPKNTIEESIMKKNKYQKEFSNYIEIMNEALKRNDFKAYSVAKNMLEETIEDCKQEKALLGEMNTNNFGILNHIFEQQLPTLIKSNKKAVKNVIKTIKEDKNLLGQFNFYNVIKNQYKGDAANLVESKEALERLAEISVKGINQDTVKESNKKLRAVMLENGIIPSEFIDDENKQLYESGHSILTRKNTTANMIPLIESYHNVCQYMENHKNDGVNNGKNIDEMIREFEEKLKTNLNESEISFIQQITDFKTPIAEKRKEKLFNKLKEDCLTVIKSMLKEDESNEELRNLNSQLNEMKFNNENVVKDIAKLLEIRDILIDD